MHAQQVTKIYLYIQFRIKLKIHKFRGTYQTIPLALFTIVAYGKMLLLLLILEEKKNPKQAHGLSNINSLILNNMDD